MEQHYQFMYKYGFSENDISPIVLNLYKSSKLKADEDLKKVVPNKFKADLALVIKSVSSADLLSRSADQLKDLVIAEPNNSLWKDWALQLIEQIKHYESAQ